MCRTAVTARIGAGGARLPGSLRKPCVTTKTTVVQIMQDQCMRKMSRARTTPARSNDNQSLSNASLASVPVARQPPHSTELCSCTRHEECWTAAIQSSAWIIYRTRILLASTVACCDCYLCATHTACNPTLICQWSVKPYGISNNIQSYKTTLLIKRTRAIAKFIQRHRLKGTRGLRYTHSIRNCAPVLLHNNQVHQ